MIMTMGALSLLYQFWIHTELIRNLGPFERILNTPSHHRVHHGSNPKYIDRNHGGTLIVWDKLFGTFEPEDPADAPRFGLTTNIHTYNPVRIAFHEWVDMGRDVWTARGWRNKLRYAFGNPDFSIQEFRSNFVARWEYKPGSSLYVVWSQGRTGDEGFWERRFQSNWNGLWRARPDNVFLLKFSYWVSP